MKKEEVKLDISDWISYGFIVLVFVLLAIAGIVEYIQSERMEAYCRPILKVTTDEELVPIYCRD